MKLANGAAVLQLDRLAEGRIAAESAAAATSAPSPGAAPNASCDADAAHHTPRVFLHGFAGGPETFAEVRAALAAGGHAAAEEAPALPGHGAPLPTPPATFHHVLETLAFHLPAKPCHLVGYSMGGRLALGLALAYPGRVRLLTLVGVHPGLEDEADRQQRRRADQSWQRCLRSQGLEAFVRAWQAQPLFASQAHLPVERLQAQQQQRYALHAEQLAQSFTCMGLAAMPNYWPALRRLAAPTLVVCGVNDTKFAKLQPRLLRLLPHGTAVQVPQVGHNVALEAPQALAELIAAHEVRQGLWPCTEAGKTP